MRFPKHLSVTAILTWVLSTHIQAAGKQPTKIDSPPYGAAFFSAQKPDQPPLPYLPFPELEVYWWDGILFFDDSDVDYEALKTNSQAESASFSTMSADPPPAPGPGGGGGSSTTFPPPYNHGSQALWLEIRRPTATGVTLILYNTGPDTNYMFFSRQQLASGMWNIEAEGPGVLETNVVSVHVSLSSRTNLFFVAGVGIDSDGDSLADAYESLVTLTNPFDADTGNTGVPDGYKDADGDGWANADEFRNRQNPLAFNPPPALTGLFKFVDGNNRNVVEWSLPAARPNTFTIERNVGGTWQEVGTVSGNSDAFTDTALAPGTPAQYRMRANYANGSSAFVSTESTSAGTSEPAYTLPATVARGVGGRLFYVAHAAENELASHRIQRQSLPSIHPKSYIFTPAYPQTFFTAVSGGSIGEFPASSITNGPALMPTSFLPYHGWYQLSFQQVGKDGRIGSQVSESVYFDATPYLDGSQHVRDNLIFALRAGGSAQPFGFALGSGSLAAGTAFGWLPSYAVAGFHWMRRIGSATFEVFDPYRPFEDNAILRNFCYNSAEFNSQGHPTSGIGFSGTPTLNNWLHHFNSLTYAQAGRSDIPANLLGTAGSQYIFYGTSFADLSAIGLTFDPMISAWRMSTTARNHYGLPYRSIRAVVHHQNPEHFTVHTIQPGGTLPTLGNLAYLYTDTEVPIFNTAGFHFANPYARNCPGDPAWNGVNVANQFILGFGKRVELAAWAKKGIQNGYSDKFGYLQLYFDKAFKIASNGAVITNETGILSEYGDFFPTEPGRTALRTKPDLAGGPATDVVVHVIKLELDVNHDGEMDGCFHGPDNTTAGRPFVFWLNNDYDRQDPDPDKEDDLPPHSVDLAVRAPDYDFKYLLQPAGQLVPGIPWKRDLEDYARLWTTGITNLIPGLPANAVIELTWRTASPQNPTLRLFRAIEADGGTDYLTDDTTAQDQLGTFLYAGVVSPTNSLQLNAPGATVAEKFIFCGASRGSGELVLRVRIGLTVVAETSAFIQIKDIKEMYERWTVGDAPGAAPLPVALPASEELPSGVSAFQYPYSATQHSNIPYVLFVHGWNHDRYAKDRRAETAFKRLYWQGYQGRFGVFRWPTTYNFPGRGIEGGGFSPNNYDNGEFQAWNSAQGLHRLLTRLNRRHPGRVRVFAHSMGNVVAGEALKLAAQPLVATYVAMQAAIASHDYDSSMPIRHIPVLADDGTPNLHANYWTAGSPAYFNGVSGASRYINFYLPVDAALNQWQTDQNFKPANSIGYMYDSALQQFRREVIGEDVRILTAPTNTYELFAYCVESRCFPLGQQAQVGGVFDSSAEVLLDPTFGFGDQMKGHSGQFRSTNMRRSAFWTQLMQSFGLINSP